MGSALPGAEQDLGDSRSSHSQAVSGVLRTGGLPPPEPPLDEAWARGYRSLRLIHGRGIGVQRAAVRRILAAGPRVLSFGDAPGEHGGWGATLVTLREGNEPAR